MSIEKEAAALHVSPTMTKVVNLVGRGDLFDAGNPEEVRSVASTCFKEMVDAMDQGTITFTNEMHRAMFHGLLGFALVMAVPEAKYQAVTDDMIS